MCFSRRINYRNYCAHNKKLCSKLNNKFYKIDIVKIDFEVPLLLKFVNKIFYYVNGSITGSVELGKAERHLK